MKTFALSIFFLVALIPKYRFIFLLLGPILALGDLELTNAKYLYLFLLIALNILSWKPTVRGHGKQNGTDQKYVHFLQVVLLALTGQIFANGLIRGLAITEMLRSSLIFIILLLSIRPLVESSKQLTTNFAIHAVGCLGVVGSFTTFVYWSQLRGLFSFGVDKIGLDGDYYGILVICLFPILASTFPKYSKVLFMYNAIILVLLFLTLTRSYIVIVVSILFMQLIFGGSRFIYSAVIKFRQLIFLGLPIVLITILLGLWSNIKFRSRILNSIALINPNAIQVSDESYKQSLLARSAQGEEALNLWLDNPIFGTGTLPSGRTYDHIFGGLLKYGIVGMILICVVFRLFYKLIGTIEDLPKYISKSYKIYLVSIFVTSSMIGNWTENKSIWLSLLVILFFSLVQERNLDKSVFKLN